MRKNEGNSNDVKNVIFIKYQKHLIAGGKWQVLCDCLTYCNGTGV
jgi:hypothetical protein